MSFRSSLFASVHHEFGAALAGLAWEHLTKRRRHRPSSFTSAIRDSGSLWWSPTHLAPGIGSSSESTCSLKSPGYGINSVIQVHDYNSVHADAQNCDLPIGVSRPLCHSAEHELWNWNVEC